MLPSKYVWFLSPIIYGDDRKKPRANKDKNLSSPKIVSTKIDKKKGEFSLNTDSDTRAKKIRFWPDTILFEWFRIQISFIFFLFSWPFLERHGDPVPWWSGSNSTESSLKKNWIRIRSKRPIQRKLDPYPKTL